MTNHTITIESCGPDEPTLARSERLQLFMAMVLTFVVTGTVPA